MIRRDVRITNRLGLHARAAARFVQTANRYRSRITLGRDTRAMDGKSILGILLLAAAQGSVLTVPRTGTTRRRGGRAGRPRRRPLRRGGVNGDARPRGLAGHRGGPRPRHRAALGADLPHARAPGRGGRRGRAPAAGGGARRASSSWPSGSASRGRSARPHGYIFDAHLLMLDDPLLVERTAEVVRERPRERGVGAAHRLRAAAGAVRRAERRVPARARRPTSTTSRAASS